MSSWKTKAAIIKSRYASKNRACVVLTTAPDLRAARRMADFLVRKRAAACVSLIPSVQSVYRWKGLIERSREVLLLIKTDSRRYPQTEKILRAIHPYDLPEILELAAGRGLPAYLRWIGESLK